MNTQCKLCLKEKPLVKSHVIPDFMYKGMFNDEHYLIKINTNNIDQGRKIHTGSFDKSILCFECDTKIIGKYETYANDIMYLNNSEIKKYERMGEDGLQDILITNINYTKFKLFLLSILWRAHISSRDDFKCVDLGKMHAERIRLMILNNDAKGIDDYATSIMYLKNNSLPVKMVGDFIKTRNNAHTAYLVLINEFLYTFNVSKHDLSEIARKTCIHSSNEISVPILEGEWASYFFDKYLGGNRMRLKNPFDQRHSAFV